MWRRSIIAKIRQTTPLSSKVALNLEIWQQRPRSATLITICYFRMMWIRVVTRNGTFLGPKTTKLAKFASICSIFASPILFIMRGWKFWYIPKRWRRCETLAGIGLAPKLATTITEFARMTRRGAGQVGAIIRTHSPTILNMQMTPSILRIVTPIPTLTCATIWTKLWAIP